MNKPWGPSVPTIKTGKNTRISEEKEEEKVQSPFKSGCLCEVMIKYPMIIC